MFAGTDFVASEPHWRSRILGSLRGQLQLATYTAVLIGFTGATTTGLWLNNRNQTRIAEAELRTNAAHLINIFASDGLLGEGHSASDWSTKAQTKVKQELRDHSTTRSANWLELADGSLLEPAAGHNSDRHSSIPREIMQLAVDSHNNDENSTNPTFIKSEGKEYLTMLIQSYPTGERLWSITTTNDSSRIQNEFLRWMVLIGVGSMSLSLITITVLVKRIVKPLLQLSERSASLTAETLSQDPIPEMKTAPKEVRQLAKTYSELIERLALSWSDQRRFVSAVSHELRTPLTIIQGYLHRTIKRGEGLTAKERRGLQTAEDESIRMRMLLDDLLDLSRGDSGRLQLNQEVVDLAVLVQKLLI